MRVKFQSSKSEFFREILLSVVRDPTIPHYGPAGVFQGHRVFEPRHCRLHDACASSSRRRSVHGGWRWPRGGSAGSGGGEGGCLLRWNYSPLTTARDHSHPRRQKPPLRTRSSFVHSVSIRDQSTGVIVRSVDDPPVCTNVAVVLLSRRGGSARGVLGRQAPARSGKSIIKLTLHAISRIYREMRPASEKRSYTWGYAATCSIQIGPFLKDRRRKRGWQGIQRGSGIAQHAQPAPLAVSWHTGSLKIYPLKRVYPHLRWQSVTRAMDHFSCNLQISRERYRYSLALRLSDVPRIGALYPWYLCIVWLSPSISL